MRKTELKRKTPLKAKTGFKRSKPMKRGSVKKTVKKKRRTKTDLQKAKEKLWTLCREITRARYGNTCYTCGKAGLEGSNWQTGHFISSSICSVELRYSLDNLRPQCYNCNINKSGNWLAFENNLKRDCGDDIVEELKARNEATKGKQYDILWYKDKIAEYEKLSTS